MAQQNVEVKIVGKDQASREILGVGTALDRMKTSVETNKAGLNKLDNALKDSAANMLGLQGTAGRLADAFLEFAPGGIVGGLAVAGIGLLISGFINSKKAQEEADESLKKYLDSQLRLNYAIDQFTMGEPDAGFKNLSEQINLLAPQVNTAEEALKKLEVQIVDIQRFERETSKQGLIARMFLGADPVSATYTSDEIKRINAELNDAATKSNELLLKRAELMLQIKNIGMVQLNADISRLGTLRELGKLGRLTTDEQKEQVFLTTKLTNLSNRRNTSIGHDPFESKS